jgi:hypothetical protein
MALNSALKILALSLALGLSACAEDDEILPPSTGTSPTSTDTFSETLTPNGADTYPFSVAAFGTVVATITKLEPNNAVVVGLSLGTWNGAACTVVTSNDKAVQGTNVSAQASGAGRLCVRIFDAAGTLPEPTTYELTVVHP